MKPLKFVLVLIISSCISSCAFEGNREVEKKLTESVNNFHSLYNQKKFEKIYAQADDELKNKFTEQQFVAYLEVVKTDGVDELKEISQVWIKDEPNSGIESILFGKKVFSNTVTVYTGKNIYIEYFEWKLADDKAKLVSYEIRESSDAQGEVIID